VPLCLQLITQVQVVVDFAVEHDAEAIAFVMHRLMAARRQIDDGEPTLGQADVATRRPPRAAIVGTTMRHSRTADIEPTPIADWILRSNTDNSAHQFIPSSVSR
jgi:hypothetical protein